MNFERTIRTRMKGIGRVVAVVVVAALAAALFTYRASLSPFQTLLSLGVIAMSVAGLMTGNVRVRVKLLAGMLGAVAVLTGARAANVDWVGDDPWNNRIYAGVLACSCFVATAGTLRRAPWSRWMALALGLSGVACGAMNLRRALVYFVSWKHDVQPLWLWSHFLLTTGALAIVLLAAGTAMKNAFGKPFVATEPDTIWSAAHPLVGAVRIALIAGFAAGATSVLYALGQPTARQTIVPALFLAAMFLFSALLTLARKTAGVLLLVVTGLGFLAQATATYALAVDRDIALYYGVFWLAAALAAAHAGYRLVSSTAR